MLKQIIEYIDAILRGIILTVIILIGVALVIFVAYAIGFLCFRTGQLLWDILFSHRWSSL
jgi:hypothetical protein